MTSAKQSVTGPVMESLTESLTEPIIEPITEPIAGSIPGPIAEPVRAFLRSLQAHIVGALETVDGGSFIRDAWQRNAVPPVEPGAEPTDSRPEASGLGGGGLTCVLENSSVFERAGVLFSQVAGARMPTSASAQRPGLGGRSFDATGVSLVIHPRNPYVPTVHMNVRFLIAHGTDTDSEPIWWFGGGMDLTPYYPFEEDVVHFHSVCKQALAQFGPDWHPRFKKWCDDYFYLPHRSEARGVGGIFFDDLNEPDFERSFALMRSVGEAFTSAYLPIVERRKAMTYGERERSFQAYRRGRYVEFNLVHDRGTLFGLQSGGRTESILCSMPPSANWRYAWQPEAGSAEARLQSFLAPREWV